MSKVKKTIMVPWDFTEKSEMAFEHAILLKRGLVDISLLHIVDKEAYIKPKTEELDKIAEELAQKYNVEKPRVIVRKGNIFKHVRGIAEEYFAMLVVMGVHNIYNKRGLRVVMGSQVPFILIQNPPKSDKIKEVVVPFDEDKRNRVQLNWVINLAKYYDCNVNIIKPFLSSNVRNENMKNQMYFIKKNLLAKGIIFGVRTSKREDEFNEAIFKFSEEIEADLVMMMSYKFKYYIKGMHDYKPPIMVFNPKIGKLAGFN